MTNAIGSTSGPPTCETKFTKARSDGTRTFPLPNWLITDSSKPRTSNRALNVVTDVSSPSVAVSFAYEEIAFRKDEQSVAGCAEAPAFVRWLYDRLNYNCHSCARNIVVERVTEATKG